MDELLTIGEFAGLSRLSPKALRLYERKGLLQPARVDPQTGYRYYRTDQLRRARLILMLRELGMPLSEIVELLDTPPESAATRLASHRRHMEAALVRSRRIIAYLQEELAGADPEPGLSVEARRLPAVTVASRTRSVTVESLSCFIQGSIAELHDWARANLASLAGPSMAIFHGPVNRVCDGPVEVCVPVRADVSGTDEGVPDLRYLPETMAATTDMPPAQAQFPEILAGYDATWLWIERHGHRHGGPPREIYGRGAAVTVARPFAAGAAI